MSEIRANTIANAAGTGPADLTGQSAAKAWVRISWGSPTIDGSENVSSITDNSVGDTSVTYTNAMASTAENSPVAGARFNNSVGTGSYLNTTTATNANGFGNVHVQNGVATDPTNIFASTFGSLA